MQHTIHAEGFGVRLRPVRMDDAAFIVWLRNQDYVKGRVGDSASDVAAQEAWLNAYFQRAGDYYFLVETLGGIPLGTHGLYDISHPTLPLKLPRPPFKLLLPLFEESVRVKVGRSRMLKNLPVESGKQWLSAHMNVVIGLYLSIKP